VNNYKDTNMEEQFEKPKEIKVKSIFKDSDHITTLKNSAHDDENIKMKETEDKIDQLSEEL